MQCWTGFYLPSYIRLHPPLSVTWILLLIELGRRSFSSKTEPCHIWGSAPFIYFFFFNLFIYLKCMPKQENNVSNVYLYLVFMFLCMFNFDLESQREVGLWCAPCSGIRPGHCSICACILTLGWIRFYCKRKHRMY